MFTHLHVHTQYSYLDGFGMEDSFAKTAKKMGFTHLGFTNHGNVDGVIKFQKACDKVGRFSQYRSSIKESPFGELLCKLSVYIPGQNDIEFMLL